MHDLIVLLKSYHKKAEDENLDAHKRELYAKLAKEIEADIMEIEKADLERAKLYMKG